MTSQTFLYIYFLFPLFLPKCLEKKTPAIGIINSAVFLTYSPISFLRLLFILLFLALSLLSIPTTTFLCLFFVYLSFLPSTSSSYYFFKKKKKKIFTPNFHFLLTFFTTSLLFLFHFHSHSSPPFPPPLPPPLPSSMETIEISGRSLTPESSVHISSYRLFT